MSLISKTTWRNSLLLFVALLCVSAASAQQQLGSIQGQIADDFGAAIPGTLVTATGPDGSVKAATSNAQGRYLLTGLLPGEYQLRATANSSAGGFGPAGGNSMAYNRRVEAQIRFTF